jgi:hypothetical protein
MPLIVRNIALPVAVIGMMVCWSMSQRANSSEDYEQHDQRVLLSLGSLLKEKGLARDYEIDLGHHSFEVGIDDKYPSSDIPLPDWAADDLAETVCHAKYLTKHPLYGVWKVHVIKINGDLAAQCFITAGQ